MSEEELAAAWIALRPLFDAWLRAQLAEKEPRDQWAMLRDAAVCAGPPAGPPAGPAVLATLRRSGEAHLAAQIASEDAKRAYDNARADYELARILADLEKPTDVAG